MQARISEVLDYIDAQRAALERTLSEVPSESRERKPAAERWSVAQVLQHLELTEAGITKVVSGFIEQARSPEVGRESETSAVSGTFDFDRVLDRSRPIVAPDGVRPREALDAGAAWERLKRRREKFRDLVVSADGLALAKVSAANPVLGPLDGYQWILFVGAHEARHTAQIREIAELLRS